MKPHTKNYINHFSLHGITFIVDEFMWIVHRSQIQAVDLHHIHQKGMGGSKLRDNVENIIALSRENHIAAHANALTRDRLQEIHNKFMKDNPY